MQRIWRRTLLLTELSPSAILKFIILPLLGLSFVSSATMQTALLFLREAWARIISEHLFLIFYDHFELPKRHFMLKSWGNVRIVICEVRGGCLSLIALNLGLNHACESEVRRMRRWLLESLLGAKVWIMVLILSHSHELLIAIHEWSVKSLIFLLGLN